MNKVDVSPDRKRKKLQERIQTILPRGYKVVLSCIVPLGEFGCADMSFDNIEAQIKRRCLVIFSTHVATYTPKWDRLVLEKPDALLEYVFQTANLQFDDLNLL